MTDLQTKIEFFHVIAAFFGVATCIAAVFVGIQFYRLIAITKYCNRHADWRIR